MPRASLVRTNPNSGLNAEDVVAYEMGYRAQPNETFSFDTALFYNVYNNLIVAQSTGVVPGVPTIVQALRVNGMSAETYGVEFSANWMLRENWRLQGNYSFLQMQLHRDPGIGASAEIGGRTLFKSSGVIRPAVLILLLALATRTTARVSTLLVALMIFGTMPMLAYRGQLERLPLGKSPIRDAAQCVRRLESQTPVPVGMFVDVPEGIWHPLYYNYRRIQPWVVASTPLDPAIDKYLHEPGAQRPLLISDAVFEAYRKAREASGLPRDSSPPLVTSINTLLLLPGPFGVCSPEASLGASN